MAANPVVRSVGADHHGHRIPTDQVLDALLQFTIARIRRLLGDRDGIDVCRVASSSGTSTVASSSNGQYGKMARLRDALSQSANAKENVTLETTVGFYRLH